MSCGAVQTGNHFLGAVLAQIDCQAQTIGAYGFGALANPNSPIAGLLLAALTLFIALFGLRLMFGDAPSGRDLVGEILKVGIVLTLATSWPAWRTLAYDTVLYGPSEIAGDVSTASGLPGGERQFNQRLDNADQGIVSLTSFGTGRLTGGIVGSTDLGDSTRGIALADQSGFAWGRVIFLAGTIGPLALVRLGAGILLALAPLMAALLLFVGTRDIFLGWLRALGACALGAVVLTLCYGAELTLLEGWLADALGQRQANVLTPAAPTELLVIALAFAALAFGALGLVVRVMFFSSAVWLRLLLASASRPPDQEQPARLYGDQQLSDSSDSPRALLIANAVAESMRREERSTDMTRLVTQAALARGSTVAAPAGPATLGYEPLGDSYRRQLRRHSASSVKRDGNQ